MGQGEEGEELVEGGDFECGAEGFGGEVNGDVLIVERDEPVGEEGGGRGAAGHEAVVVWGEGGAVEVGQDVSGEVGEEGLLRLACKGEFEG